MCARLPKKKVTSHDPDDQKQNQNYNNRQQRNKANERNMQAQRKQKTRYQILGLRCSSAYTYIQHCICRAPLHQDQSAK